LSASDVRVGSVTPQRRSRVSTAIVRGFAVDGSLQPVPRTLLLLQELTTGSIGFARTGLDGSYVTALALPEGGFGRFRVFASYQGSFATACTAGVCQFNAPGVYTRGQDSNGASTLVRF